MDTDTVQSATHAAQSAAQPYLDSGRRYMHQADEYIHQNPVPTLLGALAIGFVVGLLVRSTPSVTEVGTSRLESLRDQLEESQDNLRSLLTGLSKATKKRYKQSASAVRDGVDRAVDAVRDVDTDDYIEPASKWFRKLWKKYA